MAKVTTTVELLKGYAAGQRNFWGAIMQSANLIGQFLTDIELIGADFQHAEMYGINLSKAKLAYANLSNATLVHANLSGANLRATNFESALLRDASFEGAFIERANFTGADLSRAKFRDAKLFGGTFANCTLVPTFCAQLAPHLPPTIDYRSVIRSRHAPGLAEFLRRCRWPQVFIDYNIECAQSLSGRGVFNLLQSTLISYGKPDAIFASQLNTALQQEGVQTFFYPDHARFGDRNAEVIYRAVHEHDRVILVASEASLLRPGVLTELNEALDRETRLGGRMLVIPIAIDDYLLERWEPKMAEHQRLATKLRDRVIADFRGALDDEDRFRKQVGRLVSALKKDEAKDVPEGAV